MFHNGDGTFSLSREPLRTLSELTLSIGSTSNTLGKLTCTSSDRTPARAPLILVPTKLKHARFVRADEPNSPVHVTPLFQSVPKIRRTSETSDEKYGLVSR